MNVINIGSLAFWTNDCEASALVYLGLNVTWTLDFQHFVN